MKERYLVLNIHDHRPMRVFKDHAKAGAFAANKNRWWNTQPWSSEPFEAVVWSVSYDPKPLPTNAEMQKRRGPTAQRTYSLGTIEKVEAEPGSVWCDPCNRWWGPSSFHAQQRDDHPCRRT